MQQSVRFQIVMELTAAEAPRSTCHQALALKLVWLTDPWKKSPFVSPSTARNGSRTKTRERAALCRRFSLSQIAVRNCRGGEIGNLVSAQVSECLTGWSEAISTERGCHSVSSAGSEAREPVVSGRIG